MWCMLLIEHTHKRWRCRKDRTAGSGVGRTALRGLWRWEPRVTQSHGAGHGVQSRPLVSGLTDSPRPGEWQARSGGRPGRWAGSKAESGTGLETRILQQHQGRNQQPWDGLKWGPGQSAGAVKLSGAPRALTAACYLMFALMFVLR